MESLAPVLDYIAIERHDQQTKSGLYMPNPDRTGPQYARVVAVGPGRHSEYSAAMLPPPPCAVGDLVLFHGGAGFKVMQGGRELWFIKPGDLIAHATAVAPTVEWAAP